MFMVSFNHKMSIRAKYKNSAHPTAVLRTTLTRTTVVDPPETAAPVASVILKMIGAMGTPAVVIFIDGGKATVTAAGSPRPDTFKSGSRYFLISEQDT